MQIVGALFLLIVVIGGIGFYRGWFSMSNHNDDWGGSSGKRKVDISLSLDQEKIESDADAVKGQAQAILDNAKDSAGKLKQKAKENWHSDK